MMATRNRYRKIVVPHDGSGWSQRAVPHACDIARANNAEIILLHVFTAPARQFTSDITLAKQGDAIQEMRDGVKKYFIGLRTELRNEGINVRVQYIEGPGVSELICNYVKQERADLVVMSTHGRSGLARLVYGSIAREVMNCIDVPTMLIRPDKE